MTGIVSPIQLRSGGLEAADLRKMINDLVVGINANMATLQGQVSNVTTAAADPTSAASDVNAGFRVGDIWINTTTGNQWMCVSNAAGAATWRHIPRVLGQSAVQVVAPADTNENILATVNVPPLGANGLLEYRYRFSQTNNANAKSARLRLSGIGGTDFWTATPLANQALYGFFGTIQNRGAANSQFGEFSSGATALSNAAGQTGAVDTSVATTLVVTMQKASAGDTVNLENYFVRLTLPQIG